MAVDSTTLAARLAERGAERTATIACQEAWGR
jgi:hypothetical protein